MTPTQPPKSPPNFMPPLTGGKLAKPAGLSTALETANKILRQLGSPDDEGEWWGYDTNCGDVLPETLTILSCLISQAKLEGARDENARYSVLHGLTAVPMHEIVEREAELSRKLQSSKLEEARGQGTEQGKNNQSPVSSDGASATGKADSRSANSSSEPTICLNPKCGSISHQHMENKIETTTSEREKENKEG